MALNGSHIEGHKPTVSLFLVLGTDNSTNHPEMHDPTDSIKLHWNHYHGASYGTTGSAWYTEAHTRSFWDWEPYYMSPSARTSNSKPSVFSMILCCRLPEIRLHKYMLPQSLLTFYAKAANHTQAVWAKAKTTHSHETSSALPLYQTAKV